MNSLQLTRTLCRAAPRVSSRLTSVRCMASAAAPPPPKYYILEYKYVPDILEKRTPFRAAHIEGAKKAGEAGKMTMAGAFGAPTPEGALFIFKNSTQEEVEAFAKADPYVQNGLVPSWAIKPYAVVVEPN